jgi:hypothetical protein
MKKLLIATLPALLMGCGGAANMPTVTLDGDVNMQSTPLKDCQIIQLKGGLQRPDLWVVRCPNSNVTTQYRFGKGGNISTTMVNTPTPRGGGLPTSAITAFIK